MNLLEKRLKEKYPNEKLKVLKYTKMKDKAEVQCLSCNQIYNIKAENYLSKNKVSVCKKCGQPIVQKNKYQEKINLKYPKENILIVEFNGVKGPLKVKCLNCNTIVEYEYGQNILLEHKERICPHCFSNKKNAMENTIKNFKLWIENNNLNFKDFSFPSVIKSDTLIESKCVFCGQVNKKTIYDYMRNRGCLCGAAYVFSTKEDMQKNIGEDYEVIDFSKENNHALIKHKSCGFVYKTNLEKMVCPKCKGSKGEQKIRHFLKKNNIAFVEQYGVEIEGHHLRVDFYLPSYKIYIEFQGKQHYEKIEFFGGEQRFKKQTYNDNLKRQFLGDSLLEIKYDENIEEKINSFLVKFNEQVTKNPMV